jgi:hypothetical protein
VIASKACSGPIPLRWAYGALRGIGPTLAEEARGRMELSRCARGDLVIASKACSGPIPLRWAYLGCSAGSVLRTQEGSGEDGAFALCARGFGDRFQGSLRPDPATLGVLVWALAGRLGGGRGFRAVREGALVIASKARSGLIPLRWAYGALRGIGPTLAGRLGGGWGFRALREGLW